VIEAIVIALLALAALIYVVAPLRRRESEELERNAPIEDADARRRAAFGGLVDIESERAVGKLSQADFDALRAEYEAEALAALKELDALGHEDTDLEAEIAELRARMECPSCGALRTPGEGCSECGAPT
jgi:cytochrome c-type biogenesis protein CcmI